MSLKRISIQVFNGIASVECPLCGMRKKGIKVPVKTVTTSCPKCKQIFSIRFYIENRKFFRKKTQLEGELLSSAGRNVHIGIVIHDLSCQGAKFSLNQKNISVKIGGNVEITFSLTDGKKTEIQVEGVICRINNDQSISIKFVNVNNYSKQMKSIGFWMR
ncbi:MAG: PilZ domain-containing protein [Candidatus Moraniibacteriota bacterium]|jgi:Zn ribbon nucleic-acid-binding protein